ncbi:MAG: AAA family ATPase [Tatlockia sp.]|nr:AAA family ATPase [Tatlockia sp.]
MNKLVVITGCSGGGKSTIIAELKDQGYTVVEEAGLALLREQIAKNSDITPWQNPIPFCELMVEKSIDLFHQAKKIQSVKNQVIFFDRCVLEGVSYFQNLGRQEYDYLIEELRYYPLIFITPSWEEIYCNDEERKHSFEKALKNYEREVEFYPKCGYQIIEVPKQSVKERVKFILSAIADTK